MLLVFPSRCAWVPGVWSRGGGSAPHRRPPRGPAHRCTPGDGHDTRDGVQLHKAMMVERDNMPKCHTESSLTMKCRQLDSGHPPFFLVHPLFIESLSHFLSTHSSFIHHSLTTHSSFTLHSLTLIHIIHPPPPFPVCISPPVWVPWGGVLRRPQRGRWGTAGRTGGHCGGGRPQTPRLWTRGDECVMSVWWVCDENEC